MKSSQYNYTNSDILLTGQGQKMLQIFVATIAEKLNVNDVLNQDVCSKLAIAYVGRTLLN